MNFVVLQLVVVGALILLGWLVPLIAGIRRARQGRGGSALIVIGAVWGAMGIFIGAVGGLGVLVAIHAQRSVIGNHFDPETYDGSVGQLKVTPPGHVRLRVSEIEGGGRWWVDSTGGVVTVPAVPLNVDSVRWTARGADGHQWTLSDSSLKGDSKEIRPNPGQTLEYAAGRNLKAKVTVRSQENQAYGIDLHLEDEGGNRFSLASTGGRAPGFEAKNDQGAVVWRGKFEYG